MRQEAGPAGLSHGLLRIEVKEQEGLSHGPQHGDPQGCSQPLRETWGGVFLWEP